MTKTERLDAIDNAIEDVQTMVMSAPSSDAGDAAYSLACILRKLSALVREIVREP